MAEGGDTSGGAPREPQRPIGEQVRVVLGRVRQEPTGLAGAAIVVVLCAVISLVLWRPLSWPSQLVAGIIPDWRCSGFTPGSIPMYGCSAVLGALAIAGSVVVVVVLFVLRRPIAIAFRSLLARIPEEARFLVAPIAGTLAFAAAWAGAHYQTGGLNGLVPQTIFPAIVGLFLYAIERWGERVRAVLRPVLDVRDRYAIGYRVLAALAIPLIVSLAITAEQRVSQTALKEQIVAIIALVTGFVALMPRTGPALAGVERTLRDLGAP